MIGETPALTSCPHVHVDGQKNPHTNTYITHMHKHYIHSLIYGLRSLRYHTNKSLCYTNGETHERSVYFSGYLGYQRHQPYAERTGQRWSSVTRP